MSIVSAVARLVAAHAAAASVAARQDIRAAPHALAELSGAYAQCGHGDLDRFDELNVSLVRSRLLQLVGRPNLPLALGTLAAARELDDEDRLLIQALLDVADLERDNGQYERSSAVAVEAASLAGASLGLNDPDTLAAYNCLGMTARYQGKVADANNAYRQAQRIAEELDDHTGRANVMHNIASLEQLSGNPLNALRLIRGAVEARGHDEHGRMNDEGVLAVILTDLGDYRAARELYRTLRAGYSCQEGSDATQVVYLAANQAVLEHRAGQVLDAQRCYDEALDASTRLLGDRHPQTAIIEANLARFALDNGDRTAALMHANRAANILRPLVSSDLPALRTAEQVLEDLGH